jgi:hypothetical protein
VRFLEQNILRISCFLHVCCIPRPYYSPRFTHPIKITYRASSYVPSSNLGPDTDYHNLWFWRDASVHPHKGHGRLLPNTCKFAPCDYPVISFHAKPLHLIHRRWNLLHEKYELWKSWYFQNSLWHLVTCYFYSQGFSLQRPTVIWLGHTAAVYGVSCCIPLLQCIYSLHTCRLAEMFLYCCHCCQQNGPPCCI